MGDIIQVSHWGPKTINPPPYKT